MRAAANDLNTAMVFHVGWYYSEGQRYRRRLGHWLVVVGAGPGPNDFLVHNSLFNPMKQAVRQAVTLIPLWNGFVADSAPASGNFRGCFYVRGPGLNTGRAVAVPDGACVFRVRPSR